MTNNNIGQALLVIAATYFYFVYQLNEWFVALAVIFAAATWTYPGFSKERKQLLEAQIEMLKAKTKYYLRNL